jgi:hypothetical protein
MRHTCRGSVDGPTGFAKFEARYKPAKEFMELFMRTCVVAMKLKEFNPQNLANTINGEVEGCAHLKSQVLGLMSINR